MKFEVKNAKGVRLGMVWVYSVAGVTCCVVRWIVSDSVDHWMFFTGPTAIAFTSGNGELIAEFDGQTVVTGPCVKLIKSAAINDGDLTSLGQYKLFLAGFRCCGWVVNQSGTIGRIHKTYGENLCVRFLTCDFPDKYTDGRKLTVVDGRTLTPLA